MSHEDGCLLHTGSNRNSSVYPSAPWMRSSLVTKAKGIPVQISLSPTICCFGLLLIPAFDIERLLRYPLHSIKSTAHKRRTQNRTNSRDGRALGLPGVASQTFCVPLEKATFNSPTGMNPGSRLRKICLSFISL